MLLPCVDRWRDVSLRTLLLIQRSHEAHYNYTIVTDFIQKTILPVVRHVRTVTCVVNSQNECRRYLPCVDPNITVLLVKWFQILNWPVRGQSLLRFRIKVTLSFSTFIPNCDMQQTRTLNALRLFLWEITGVKLDELL